MCGWRTYMEDKHIVKDDIGNGCSLFAVFDGHGGNTSLSQEVKSQSTSLTILSIL